MADLPHLDPQEQRVLGSLMEKEITVPASYPMTLNSLRLACNQSTSRDPVVDYDDNTLVEVTLRLQQRQLVRLVRADSGGRAVKYKQRLTETLETFGVGAPERALLTVLLLRGAQAPGELKTRTERLHGFADRYAVEACLRELASGATPLVHELERMPGQQDHRWIHLLGPVELPETRAARVAGVGGRMSGLGATPGVGPGAVDDGPGRLWLDYDEASDTAYLALGEAGTAAITGADPDSGSITVDLDDDGRIVGVRFAGAGASLPSAVLGDRPE
ncbi:MAG: DUF480 domain-containing protein [Dermatophilaceae bacterium]